jgi:hypothetical protein
MSMVYAAWAGEVKSRADEASAGCFYPDFVCKLKDGRILVVEYKGGHL